MSKLTLTADDGQRHFGNLPDSFAKVPLARYAALATAETLPDRIRATAALCGLPAAPLLHDVKLYAAILQAAPWLFADELPTASAPVAYFTHQGTTYHHVGALTKINAQQMEALLGFLAESDGKPLDCAPGLLAVLYCPEGKEQTAEVVAAAVEAFATLPMSIAFPALSFFVQGSAACATSILTASALSAQVRNLLATLEEASRAGGDSPGFSLRPQRWLFKMWIQSAKKML